jgi:hypothetical protein
MVRLKMKRKVDPSPSSVHLALRFKGLGLEAQSGGGARESCKTEA